MLHGHFNIEHIKFGSWEMEICLAEYFESRGKKTSWKATLRDLDQEESKILWSLNHWTREVPQV